MNKELFKVNERPDEYEATFSIEGEVSLTIKAESLEAAKAKAQAMLDDEEFGHELDSVEMADVRRVFKTPPMFLVLREGKVMQVSRLMEGDEPREYTESGF